MTVRATATGIKGFMFLQGSFVLGVYLIVAVQAKRRGLLLKQLRYWTGMGKMTGTAMQFTNS